MSRPGRKLIVTERRQAQFICREGGRLVAHQVNVTEHFRSWSQETAEETGGHADVRKDDESRGHPRRLRSAATHHQGNLIP